MAIQSIQVCERNEMITDEQILTTFNKHPKMPLDQPLCIYTDNLIRDARTLIALAQQIKPLEFEKAGYWVKADCSFGRYVVSDEAGIWQIFLNGNVFECEYINKAEAIAAANEDYRKRVLSCLVHGGV